MCRVATRKYSCYWEKSLPRDNSTEIIIGTHLRSEWRKSGGWIRVGHLRPFTFTSVFVDTQCVGRQLGQDLLYWKVILVCSGINNVVAKPDMRSRCDLRYGSGTNIAFLFICTLPTV
jgi:hypothetical protein